MQSVPRRFKSRPAALTKSRRRKFPGCPLWPGRRGHRCLESLTDCFFRPVNLRRVDLEGAIAMAIVPSAEPNRRRFALRRFDL
jgi:hypothetical protein